MIFKLLGRSARIQYTVRMRAVLWFVGRLILGLLILFLANQVLGAIFGLLGFGFHPAPWVLIAAIVCVATKLVKDLLSEPPA